MFKGGSTRLAVLLIFSNSADFSLSGGCFGIDIVQEMDEIVSDRSSQAETISDFRTIVMRVLELEYFLTSQACLNKKGTN